MNDVFDAASDIQRFCADHGWPFCFIGGVAVQRWGEPRQTRDVDLTIVTGFGNEAPFIDELLAHFPTRGDHPRDFALRNRVLLLLSDDGVGIDVALGALPFEQRAVTRATPWVIHDDLELTTCSAEDLIVWKVFAGRPQDWSDVEMILTRQTTLDTSQILSELLPLLELKDADQDAARIRHLLDAP